MYFLYKIINLSEDTFKSDTVYILPTERYLKTIFLFNMIASTS